MGKNLAEELERELKDLSPEEGIALVADQYGSRAKFSTSFGLEDQVITHMIAKRVKADQRLRSA